MALITEREERENNEEEIILLELIYSMNNHIFRQ